MFMPAKPFGMSVESEYLSQRCVFWSHQHIDDTKSHRLNEVTKREIERKRGPRWSPRTMQQHVSSKQRTLGRGSREVEGEQRDGEFQQPREEGVEKSEVESWA